MKFTTLQAINAALQAAKTSADNAERTARAALLDAKRAVDALDDSASPSDNSAALDAAESARKAHSAAADELQRLCVALDDFLAHDFA